MNINDEVLHTSYTFKQVAGFYFIILSIVRIENNEELDNNF